MKALRELLETLKGWAAVIFLGIGTFFYILYDRERKKNLSDKIRIAEKEAEIKARERHEETKKGGSVSIAKSISSKLGDS